MYCVTGNGLTFFVVPGQSLENRLIWFGFVDICWARMALGYMASASLEAPLNLVAEPSGIHPPGGRGARSVA